MTPETLHPDIERDLREMGRTAVEVIDPSPGLFGENPIPGLVRVLYECSCDVFPSLPLPHTHDALYGPKDEKGTDSGYTIYAD